MTTSVPRPRLHHLALNVADKPLPQSPVAEEVYGSVLVFRDPDNIQLEFFAPPGQ
jgi:hypothetical protein